MPPGTRKAGSASGACPLTTKGPCMYLPDSSRRGFVRTVRDRLRGLTASATAGGVMLVGMPLVLEYVVRPGDTLSEIAVRHDTTVDRLVARNGLHGSGDRIVAGESLDIPAAHPRPAAESERVDPDARRIVRYTVKPGDTPSGLAVRFHAWTDELVERNGPVLHVGDEIEIPVVVAASRERRTHSSRSGAHPPVEPAPAETSGPSRATVRRVIAATARRHGVDPSLALAVAWQESGWQMHHVSSAGAVGAMQVMPSTGRWMSTVVGSRLHLRDVRDNATAGVVLLDLLLEQAQPRVAVAGYYQGLAGVRKHGMYADTKRYVANVQALRRQFDLGDYPA
jgi:soluble lytic murein transglycosylase-like protein